MGLVDSRVVDSGFDEWSFLGDDLKILTEEPIEIKSEGIFGLLGCVGVELRKEETIGHIGGNHHADVVFHIYYLETWNGELGSAEVSGIDNCDTLKSVGVEMGLENVHFSGEEFGDVWIWSVLLQDK